MPHAPIVHPAVAGARAPAVRATTEAMRAAARVVLENEPDRLVVISPHARRLRMRWAIATGARLQGSLAPFGAARVRVSLPIAVDLARELASAAADAGEVATLVPARELDHGALVPLAFLVEAGWRGPTLEIALPGEPAPEGFHAMGRALAAAARDLGGGCVLVASGDASHRLTADAPGGFEPRAGEFDDALADLLESGALARVRSIDRELVELAGEDVVASLSTAIAAVGEDATGHRLLSHEAPFGVGYLVAVLHAEASAPIGAAQRGAPA
jgi:aromatic ring-opening dioxygenase LigB subunit